MATGDETALAELYDAFAPRVYALARAIVADTADAEEIVSDTFMQVWRSARSFDAQRGSMAAWVATIARSRALDRRRRSTRRSEARERVFPSFETSDPDRLPMARAEVARLGPALDAMADEQRRAIELAYFGGLTHREIAAETGAPLGTVKTRIRAGMAQLREAIGSRVEEGAP